MRNHFFILNMKNATLELNSVNMETPSALIHILLYIKVTKERNIMNVLNVVEPSSESLCSLSSENSYRREIP